mgnify:CR=1 FL=1
MDKKLDHIKLYKKVDKELLEQELMMFDDDQNEENSINNVSNM